MSKEKVLGEMRAKLGLVPGFFAQLPEASLEDEWRLFQKVELDEGPIPHKYQQLMGLAVAAATKCRYCTFMHTEMAKVAGATPEEIQSVLQYTKSSTGWSSYINGLQYDLGRFREEVSKICDHVRQSTR